MSNQLCLRFFSLLVVVCSSTIASAGPNTDGTLILHANTALSYSTETAGYCGQGSLPSCDAADSEVSTGMTPTVFFAYAAFPESATPRVRGVTFGIDYDAGTIELVDYGPCADLELAAADWPDPGSGVALTWTTAKTDTLIEVYWFAAYAYADTGRVSLTPHPVQGGAFADDSIPSQLDPITEYGALGFGTAGALPCPLGDSGGQGGGGGGGGGGDSSPTAPIPGCLSPSTDTQPFALVDIYVDQISAVGCVEPGATSGYPEFLDDPALLVLRDADTLGVVNSFANDGIRVRRDPGSCDTTRIEFSIDPPRLASSAIFLATGSIPFERNLSDPLAYITFRYTDESESHDTLKIGDHLREWHTYHPVAGEDCRDFVFTAPTSPASGEVWTGTRTTPPDTLWYDVTEVGLSRNRLSKKIESVVVTSDSSGVFCETDDKLGQTFAPAGTIIHGITLATEFRCLNDEDDPVETQHQYEPWGDDSYGGYVYNDEIVGADDDLRKFGCALTCCSMLLDYYGRPCTPPDLDAFMRSTRRYDRVPRGSVTYVSGQDVGDTVLVNKGHQKLRYKIGHGLVIENTEPYVPTADLDVVSLQGQTAVAIIAARPDTTSDIEVGNIAWGHDDVFWDRTGYYSGGSGFIVQRSTSVAVIESTLAAMEPVVLSVGFDTTACSGHFVVADGMRPNWSTYPPRGTYTIHDPGYSAPRELFHPRYRNSFSSARLIRPRASNVEESVSLSLRLSGSARMRIVDPGLREVAWDEELGEYVSSVPGAFGAADVAVTELGDSIPWNVSDEIEIPDAMSGGYLLWVVGTDDLPYTLAVQERSQDDGIRSYGRLGEAETGQIDYYLIDVSVDPDTTVLVTELDPTGVPGVSGPSNPVQKLRIAPNPSRSSATIAFDVAEPGHVILDIVDVQGRRIVRLVDEPMVVGTSSLRWTGNDAKGVRVPSGVYWVRLATDNRQYSERVVVLK